MLNPQPKDTSRAHFWLSHVKSSIRIAAGLALVWPQNVVLAGLFLIVAEIFGIAEEIF